MWRKFEDLFIFPIITLESPKNRVIYLYTLEDPEAERNITELVLLVGALRARGAIISVMKNVRLFCSWRPVTQGSDSRDRA